MRVNSVFTSAFTSPWVVGGRLTIVLLVIFLTASSFTTYPGRDLKAKQVNLIIRQIGHRLLLQAGDSTSRVLPVTETTGGTFVLSFENELNFSHDSLMALSQGLLPETGFPSGYTVTVHDCLEADIVYGFQLNNGSPDILPCQGRREPLGCYTIEFAFPDFYANVEPVKKTDQPTHKPKPVKVARQEAKPKPEEPKAKEDIGRPTKEPKPLKGDLREANPEPEEFKATTFDYAWVNLVFCGALVLLGVTLLIGRFGKISPPVAVQHQGQTTTKEPARDLPALGKFLFDSKGKRLLLGREVIGLTDKECNILELFSKNFGELITRETLMQEVWINEGVITGRSLDMFVSKLRKKLSGDPELRITNVHGRGYKLEIAS